MFSAIDAKHQFGAFLHYFGEMGIPASGSGCSMLHQPITLSWHWLSLLPMSTSSTDTCFGDRILEEDNGIGDGCKVTPAKTQWKHCYWSHLAKCDWAKSEPWNGFELGRDTFHCRLLQGLSSLDGHAWTWWVALQRGQGQWLQLCHCL